MFDINLGICIFCLIVITLVENINIFEIFSNESKCLESCIQQIKLVGWKSFFSVFKVENILKFTELINEIEKTLDFLFILKHNKNFSPNYNWDWHKRCTHNVCEINFMSEIDWKHFIFNFMKLCSKTILVDKIKSYGFSSPNKISSNIFTANFPYYSHLSFMQHTCNSHNIDKLQKLQSLFENFKSTHKIWKWISRFISQRYIVQRNSIWIYMWPYWAIY